MSRPMPSQPSPMSFEQMQEAGTNLVFMFTSIFTRPLELILRPWHGSRYHSPVVVFLSSALMLMLPLFAAGVEGALSTIPFGPHLSVTPAFDIGSLAKL